MLRYLLLLIGMLTLPFGATATMPQRANAIKALRTSLHTYLNHIDSAVAGVAVITPEGDSLTFNNDKHYPLMSVYKLHQALAVADYLTRHHISPDDSVYIPANELHTGTYSPLKEQYPQGDVCLKIKDLFRYTLQFSDNNVCDFLFRHYVSPQETQVFLNRKTKAREFAIHTTEEQMGRDLQLCYSNWTTPYAAATLLQEFLSGKVVADPYFNLIKDNMLACQTGNNKLASPLLKTKTAIGHKTGAGPRTTDGRQIANNDLAFILLPNGKCYILSVFIKDNMLDTATSDKIHADISQIVYQHIYR